MTSADNSANWRILVIDDNRAIHEDFKKVLGRHGESNASFSEAKAALFGSQATEGDQVQFEIDSAYQGEEGLLLVKKAFDEGRPYALAFVDIRMPPGWDGIETVTRMWKVDPSVQVVICTAYSDYSWDEMIRHMGKSSNWVILKKPFDNIEVLQMAHSLTRKWTLDRELRHQLQNLDALVQKRTEELQSANLQLSREITERMEIEKALRASEERFSLAFMATPIPTALMVLGEGLYLDANAAFEALTGFTCDRLKQTPAVANGFWKDAAAWAAAVSELSAGKPVLERRAQIRVYDDLTRDVLFSAQPLRIGFQTCALVIMQDITDQLRLESELRQAQKMDAIGQLAAGVAHDFNNLLTVILCSCATVLKETTLDPEMRDNINQIRTASERAASLTRQLLVFSRKQVTQVKQIDPAGTLLGLNRMLSRLIGDQISLVWDCPSGLPRIFADAGNFEQVVVNLLINARDALPRGGEVRVELRNVLLNEEGARRHLNARPGRFVSLSVSDNGCGMDAEVQRHLFEPFFTTKPVGKGTGLGLSTVYAILHQHGGWIEVRSEVGVGSTFTLFFPAVPTPQEAPSPVPQVQPVKQSPKGRERILLVEDDPVILSILSLVLKKAGYQITVAKNGATALETWAAAKEPFEMLVSDIVMPGGISGIQLARRLMEVHPELKVILMTGYSTELLEDDPESIKVARILLKPFTHEEFVQSIRDVLDAKESA